MNIILKMNYLDVRKTSGTKDLAFTTRWNMPDDVEHVHLRRWPSKNNWLFSTNFVYQF